MPDSQLQKRVEKGVEFVRITMPAARVAQLRKLAADEGISVQALLAPVLGALATGRLRTEYVMPAPAPGRASHSSIS